MCLSGSGGDLDQKSEALIRGLQLGRPGGVSLLRYSDKKDNASGKTAVLFNMALKAFARRKYRVLFVCNRQKMERRAKSIANLLEFEDGAFKNVFMRYVADADGLMDVFAQMHTYQAPNLVIVDDFSSYFSSLSKEGLELHIKTTALIQNAINHASDAAKAAGEKIGCRGVIVDEALTSSPFCDIKRFICQEYNFDNISEGIENSVENSGLNKADTIG